MSFSSVDNKKQYATDGIVDTFAFPYPFQATGDLVVKLKDNTTLLVTTLVETTDYSVTTVGDTGRYDSGSIVTTSVLASGSTITILRIVANDQETANYNPGGDFDEQSTEDAFDKATMQSQQNYNGAVILKKSGDVDGPLELPDLADNATKFLQINSAGDGITAADSAVTSDARVNSLFNGAAADDIFTTFINLANGALIIDGTGSPEGVTVAPVGSIFLRTDGAADTSIYFKETGAGDTGWGTRGVLAAPTIASFVNSAHDHADAAGGGNLGDVTAGDVTADTINTDNTARKTKELLIGDWDMNAAGEYAVAHGLTLAKIRTIDGVIRDDNKTLSFPIGKGDATDTASTGTQVWFGGQSGGGNAKSPIDATNINLARLTGGQFDAVGYDDVGGAQETRGWITVEYVE